MNESLSTKDAKKLAKASILSTSDDPKKQDRARARQTEVDYKDLLRQIKARKKKKIKESFVLEREDSPYEKASDKALDKKYGYGTSHDKGPKTGFGRASNRNTAAAVLKDIRRRKSKSTTETRADAAHKGWSATARTSKDQTPEKKATRKKLADTPYKKLPKDEQEKDQVAADAVKKEYDKRKKNESVNEGASIIQGGTSRKKVSYRGPTAEKSKPKKSVSYRGEKDERIPVLNRKGKENKSARYASQLHRLRPRSERLAKESLGFTIDSGEHNKAKKKGKMRNLAIKNPNKNEGDVAHKKAGGPKLIGEGEIADKLRKVIADMKAADRKAGLLPGGKDVIDLDVERERRRKKKIKEGKTWDSWKKAAANALKKKKEEKKAQPATDAGARARRKLKDKEHNKYVNFLHADDD